MQPEIWSLIAVISFWSWVITFLLFIFKAFPRIGIFQIRQAQIWGGLSLLSASLWVIALRNA
jgi:hypothetical protein